MYNEPSHGSNVPLCLSPSSSRPLGSVYWFTSTSKSNCSIDKQVVTSTYANPDDWSNYLPLNSFWSKLELWKPAVERIKIAKRSDILNIHFLLGGFLLLYLLSPVLLCPAAPGDTDPPIVSGCMHCSIIALKLKRENKAWMKHIFWKVLACPCYTSRDIALYKEKFLTKCDLH